MALRRRRTRSATATGREQRLGAQDGAPLQRALLS